MKETSVYVVAFVLSLLAVVAGVALVRTGVAEVTGALLVAAGAYFAVDAMFAYSDARHPVMMAAKRPAPRRRRHAR